jgi:hypothetical protein
VSQRVAAAEAAAKEIQSSVEEWKASDVFLQYELVVNATGHMFHVHTKTGWRQIRLHAGHKLSWFGKVRAGARGDLLFELVPEMNAELEDRGADRVEVAAKDFTVLEPDFLRWLCEQLGVESLDEFVLQAFAAVTGEDVKRAAQRVEDPEPAPDVEALPQWGAWA